MKRYKPREWELWSLVNGVTNQRGERRFRRILLSGARGTGKTTAGMKAGAVYSVTLHEESSVTELIGHWVPQGQAFTWHDGVMTRAWKEGSGVVINEIDKASGSVLTQLYAFLDDPEVARLTLPNGETIRPREGFFVVATMNGEWEDIPLPLLDRFDIRLRVRAPHPDAVEKLEPQFRELVVGAYSVDDPVITYREVLAFQQLSEALGQSEVAAEIVFGERANDVLNSLRIGQREEGTEEGEE